MLRRLLIVEQQPRATDPLGSALGALVTRLASLTSTRLAVGAGVIPQAPTGSLPPVSSLVQRIEALRRLLVGLTRIDPSYAARLAPTLAALRALLAKLAEAQPGITSFSGDPPGGGAITAATVPSPATAPPGWPAVTYGPAVTEWLVQGAPPGAQSTASSFARPGAAAPNAKAPPTPGTASAAHLVLDVLPAGGPSSSVGAAGSSGAAPAGTLAITPVVILLVGLVSGRLALIVLPWRLAVLGYRLERPG